TVGRHGRRRPRTDLRRGRCCRRGTGLHFPVSRYVPRSGASREAPAISGLNGARPVGPVSRNCAEIGPTKVIPPGVCSLLTGDSYVGSMLKCRNVYDFCNHIESSKGLQKWPSFRHINMLFNMPRQTTPSATWRRQRLPVFAPCRGVWCCTSARVVCRVRLSSYPPRSRVGFGVTAGDGACKGSCRLLAGGQPGERCSSRCYGAGSVPGVGAGTC